MNTNLFCNRLGVVLSGLAMVVSAIFSTFGVATTQEPDTVGQCATAAAR